MICFNRQFNFPLFGQHNFLSLFGFTETVDFRQILNISCSVTHLPGISSEMEINIVVMKRLKEYLEMERK